MAKKPSYQELEIRIMELENEILQSKRAEEALHQKEALLNMTQQISKVGGWTWDVQKQKMFWTDETYRIHGFKLNEIEPGSTEHIDRSLFCYDDKDRSVIIDAFQKCISEGVAYDMEFPFTTLSGKRIWIRTAARAIKKNGKVIQVHGNIADITERKQFEEQLSRAAEEWQTTFDATNSSIWVLDKDHIILRSNKSAEKIFQRSNNDLIGKRCWEVVHGTDRPVPECPTLRSKKSLQRESMELQLNERWVEVIVDPITNAEGDYVSAVHIVTDITARKQREQELRKTAHSLSEAQKLAHVGSWEWDLKSGKIEWSEEVYRIFGLDPKQFKPQIDSVMNRFHPDDQKKHRDLIEKSLTNKETYTFEARILIPDGSVRQVISTAQGRYDKDERLIAILGTIHDITERKIAEERLRMSEESYRTIFDSGNDAIFIHDIETGAILDVNNQICELVGYTRNECLNMNIADMSLGEPPYTQKEVLEWIGRAKAQGPQKFHWIAKKKSGKTLWVDVTLKRVVIAGTERILATVRDISDQKMSQEKIKEERKRFYSTLEKIPAFVCLLSQDYKIQYANEEFRRLFGDTENKTCYNAYHGRNKPCEICRTFNVFETKAKQVQEWKRRDDEIYMIYDNFLDDIDGSPLVLEMGVDITERKLANRALKESHDVFLTVLDGIDATVYVADMDTYEVLFMNKYMKKSFGNDFTGRICWEVFRNETGPCSYCTNNLLLDGDGNPSGVHIWNDQNPVSGKWYINYDRAIKWPDGRLVRLQIATDISDLKTMEDQLRQAQKMESVGTLAGGIAHDFNNIISIILGNTELAIEDVTEWNPVHSNLEEIKSACLRATNITKQLLSFSRKTEHKQQPIEVALVIKDALKFLRSTIPTTVDIKQNIEVTDETILADSIQIYQVMMNLCINAAQAMEQTGGVLTINVEKVFLDDSSIKEYPDLKCGEHIKITVGDTGSGIAPDIIDRIFDPYFTTKEVGQGSGMGLAVVHGVVRNHSGAILVDSYPGRGTTFKIFFPMAEGKITVETAAIQELPKGNETILFIDDERPIVETVKQMLDRLGYNVETAIMPQDALKRFKSKPYQFDLVITDMTMPQMTGVKLSEELMKIRPDIPIIICTGHSTLVDEEKAKALGLAAFVMKPINMLEIAQSIRKVLDKK